MVDLVYGVTLQNKLFEGVVQEMGIFKSVRLADNTSIMLPHQYKLYPTQEERNISLFNNKQNQFSLNKVSMRYNLSLEETISAYEKALILFPEKFI